MVHTRHRTSEEGPVLPNENNPKTLKRESVEELASERHTYKPEEPVQVESRLRPRVGPNHAYNYLDADSSDDAGFGRRHKPPVHQLSPRRRALQARMVKRELLEASSKGCSYGGHFSEEEEEAERGRRQGLRLRRPSRKRRYMECGGESEDESPTRQHEESRRSLRYSKYSRRFPAEVDEQIERSRPTRSTSRRIYQCAESEEDETEIQSRDIRRTSERRSIKIRDKSHESEDEEQMLSLRRRSSRSRKPRFDSLNQSDLVDPSSVTDNLVSTLDNSQDHKDHDSDMEDKTNDGFSDMYSRVKRKRVKIKRDMYGVPLPESDSDEDDANQNNDTAKSDEEEEEEEEEDDSQEDEEEVENEDESNKPRTRSLRSRKKSKMQIPLRKYSLREHKPRTELYKAPVEEKRRRVEHSVFETTPTKKNPGRTYQSPAQRRSTKRRRAHNSSSTSSSSSSDSSDEEKFQRRKSKSMNKARSKMLPMNFTNNAKPSAIIKDRVRSGASLADVEPMTIDRSITFESIGGYRSYIRALKEMVVFPLLYDKVFKRFKCDPPKGVLFHGPPGTGKTLMARALANECSTGDKKVAFFMRKGADCLSEWVGESERQLRLLFDQAYKYRPSIIFFDEIDGLAPVRSSRQDQIHSSIVSTLLALMDGLDQRGEIVVVGATNRIDALDPALRRPGRFDREFLFPLPDFEARKQILTIHTASWQPKLNETFISQLAEKCVGYCGADLRALCTEAAMQALRRRYPQIYLTDQALELDENSITLNAKDFFNSMATIVPTSQRSVCTPARALAPRLAPLLQTQMASLVEQLAQVFPHTSNPQLDKAADCGGGDGLLDELGSDEDEAAPSIFVTPAPGARGRPRRDQLAEGTSHMAAQQALLDFTSYEPVTAVSFRPRLLLAGAAGAGQTGHLGPALLHRLEGLPTHTLDTAALYTHTARCPEEAVAQLFREARRKTPSVVFVPSLDVLWPLVAGTESLRAVFLSQLRGLEPTLPLLLLATADLPYTELDDEVKEIFDDLGGEVAEMINPGPEERRAFFEDLILNQACRPPPQKKQAATRLLEVLPVAKAATPKELNSQELKALEEKEELTLMELRIFLRDVLNKLGSDKKFSIFAKPVDIEDAPDYFEVIEQPMDLSTMMSKIDLHEYGSVANFLHDIDLITSNALEYNPNRGHMDRIIRHRACAMKDTAYAIIKTELDKDFERMCVEIQESRARRGKKPEAPKFYYTKPRAAGAGGRGGGGGSTSSPAAGARESGLPSYLDMPKPVRSIPQPDGERFSKRVRGLTVEPTPALESIEKKYKASSPVKTDPDHTVLTPKQDEKPDSDNDIDCDKPEEDNEEEQDDNDSHDEESTLTKDKTEAATPNNAASKDKASSGSKSKKGSGSKCVWCKPSRRGRRTARLRKPQTDNAEDVEEDEGEDVDEDNQCLNNSNSVNSDSLLSNPLHSSSPSIKPDPCLDNNTPSNKPLTVNVNDSRERRSSTRSSARYHSPRVNSHTLLPAPTPTSPIQPVSQAPSHSPSQSSFSKHISETSASQSSSQGSSTSCIVSPKVGVKTRRASASPRGAGACQTALSQVSPKTTVSELPSVTKSDAQDSCPIPNSSSQSQSTKETLALLSADQNKVPASEPGPPVGPVEVEAVPLSRAVKRLDLGSGPSGVVLDSGVGSSLDSNTDSRDSLDPTPASNKTVPSQNEDKKELEVPMETTPAPAVPVASTASDLTLGGSSSVTKMATLNINNSAKTRAKQILSTSAAPAVLVCDQERLKAVLAGLVAGTAGRTVEGLERAWAGLHNVVVRHRHAWDRTPMIQELEEKIRRLTTSYTASH